MLSKTKESNRKMFFLGSMFKELVLEYCNESSIHGIRYLVDKRKTILERFCWIIFLIFSIASCFWFVVDLYISAQRSSIVMTISNRPMKISDILFPSVTICPTIPFNVSVINVTALINTYRYIYSNTSSLSMEEEEVILHNHCGFLITSGIEHLNINYVNTLLKVNLRIKTLNVCLLGIQGNQNKKRCFHVLQEIITNNGVCYSYNAIHTKDLFWSNNGLTYNYPDELLTIKNNSYEPQNFIGPNDVGRLRIGFRMAEDEVQNTCRPHENGFIVAFRSPYDVVVINSADITAKEDFETAITLTPKVLQSSEGLRSFKVSERECYFDNERSLYFIRYYTQDNCHFECLTNITLLKCGCVLFYMPRFKTTPVCARNTCSTNVEREYDNMGIGICQCYPLCNSVSFDLNVATHLMSMEKYNWNLTRKEVDTRFSAFSKEKYVYPLLRSQLYGFSDYVASFGGLLGLFLGVSILSIIELFYYIFMRPLCIFLSNLRKSSSKIALVPMKTNDKDLIRKNHLIQKH